MPRSFSPGCWSRKRFDWKNARSNPEAYAGLAGEKDEAFRYLTLAIDQRERYVVGLKVNPLFDSLRSDRRFAAALKRVNLY